MNFSALNAHGAGAPNATGLSCGWILKWKVLFGVLFGLSLMMSLGAQEGAEPIKEAVEAAAPEDDKIDPGHTAWMLASCALVLLMTPGLALFYGGMVRSKNVLGTIMHSMFCMGLMSVLWVVVGYSIAFGESVNGLFGNPGTHFLLKDVAWDKGGKFGDYPDIVFMAFQMMFAIITPALITGAFAERVKFRSFIVFCSLWSLLIYAPLAHWVWGGGILAHGEGTWLHSFTGNGAHDFAGGNVVHISSGFSALIVVLFIGRRRGYPDQAMAPNSLIWTMLGAGLLWFGWYGFNGGSALASNGVASLAFVNTHIAAAVAAVVWAIIEKFHHGKASALGFASGLVAGLVCITPAAGFVEPGSAILMGAIVAPVCYAAVVIAKVKLGYDDTLDAFGIHGIGGMVGALLTGVFLTEALSLGDTQGGASQLWTQFVSVVVTVAFAAIGTAILVKLVDLTLGFRVSEEEESQGLDVAVHGETGYNL